MDIHLFDEIWPGDAAVLQAQLAQVSEGEDINLLINSPGGSVPEGMAIASLIKQHPSKVTANIIGLAASMATVVALAADNVNMVDGGIFMVHHPSMGGGGNAKELKEKAELVDAISKPIINIYSKKTGLGKKVISALMDKAELMPAKKAKQLRFVDKVTEPLAMVAKLNLTNYKDMNYDSIMAKINDFAKDFGFAETTEDEAKAIKDKKEAEAIKLAEELKAKVLKAETAEEAISAELVTQAEFKPVITELLAATKEILAFITAQPSEKELVELQAKAAQEAVTQLVKDIKNKVQMPVKTGDPVITKVTPFKEDVDTLKARRFEKHYDKTQQKNIKTLK